MIFYLSLRGTAMPEKGFHHSKESREKMSSSRKGKKFSEEHKKSLSKNNGMKGRSIYDVWLEKYGKEEADRKWEEFREKARRGSTGRKASKETKEKMKKSLKGKKGNHEYWVEKYGKEEADRRWQEACRKNSLKNSGKNNAMYGVSPSHIAGIGYSGRYKSFLYFRSFLELSFFIREIENSNIKWESGEKRKYQVIYKDSKGVDRTYRPDFVVGKTIYEVKPVKLQKTKLNQEKFEAAEKAYSERGFNYQVVCPELFPVEFWFSLFERGDIVFSGKVEERFKRLLRRNKIYA
jgi:hypothetical protein